MGMCMKVVFALLQTVSPVKLPGGCQLEIISVIRDSLFLSDQGTNKIILDWL